jgi:citronellol/citronellal dehydrogenase
MTLRNRTLFITGASRGIGLAIALRAARDGANIAIAAKTADPHPRLPGTVYTAAKEIEAAGGVALPLIVDVRDEDSVQRAVDQAASHFNGIDICVNNASAISLSGTADTPLKRFDLMHQVNTRGTFVTTRACLPYLKRGNNPHVLMLSPPLELHPRWFALHVAYSLSKYGMSLCTLGMAEEFRPFGIAVNALWPRTLIATAAVNNVLGGEKLMRQARHPAIMADAAYSIFTKSSREFTGHFLLDDAALAANGVRDFDPYRYDPSSALRIDYFVDRNQPLPPGVSLEPLAGRS